ncbi:MAG: hypothetical protein IGQ45_04185 [Cyanobacterium sp. T60_A2020_053]|nr:hypothetical protein [Cyanobacterium sp. T60_A2020_053]
MGAKGRGYQRKSSLLWIALATMITPNHHPFCGQKIEKVAPQADFVPLYLSRGGKNLHSGDLLKTELESNDILYLTIPAHRLEQLWREPNSTVNSGMPLLY